MIVGGSLVGLSTALFLRLHGISCLAVERHPGTAIHPRAGHFQLRTVEILRSAGLEESVRRKGEEQYHPNGGINNVESLAGREIASYFSNVNAGVDEFSPTVRLFIDQDALEPILRARAEELGAAVRYRVDCESVSQDDEGVTATLRDLDGGSERTVRSRYVVAADGNRSRIREQLGIAMRGHGLLSQSITIYFRAEVDLAPLLTSRDQGVNYVTNPVLRGFFRLDRSGNRGFSSWPESRQRSAVYSSREIIDATRYRSRPRRRHLLSVARDRSSDRPGLAEGIVELVLRGCAFTTNPSPSATSPRREHEHEDPRPYRNGARQAQLPVPQPRPATSAGSVHAGSVLRPTAGRSSTRTGCCSLTPASGQRRGTCRSRDRRSRASRNFQPRWPRQVSASTMSPRL